MSIFEVGIEYSLPILLLFTFSISKSIFTKKITCQNLLYLTKETGDTVLLYSSNYIFVDFVVSQIQINMISILPF